MKMLRYISCATVLTIFLAIYITPASAKIDHWEECIEVFDPETEWDEIIKSCAEFDVERLSRIDILYPGTPQPGIFTDITLFPTFTSYTTDGETYIHIYPSQPINLTYLATTDPGYKQIVTFKTILDWGELGEPTPFTFVEWDSDGTQFSGVIYNVALVGGGVLVPVDKLALLAPYIALASAIIVATAATAIYVKRVKHRKEKQ